MYPYSKNMYCKDVRYATYVVFFLNSHGVFFATWKVDGATPHVYIIAPYKSPPFGGCTIYFPDGIQMYFC